MQRRTVTFLLFLLFLGSVLPAGAMTFQERKVWTVPAKHRVSELYRFGDHWAVRVTTDTAAYFVVDGKKLTEHEMVSKLYVGSSGKKWAFYAYDGVKTAVVTDAGPGPAHDSATSLAFDPAGGRVAYLAREGRRWFLFDNGVRSAPYDLLHQLNFTPAGRLTVMARQKTQHFFLSDGKPWPAWDLIGSAEMLTDGRIVTTAFRGEKRHLVIDGKDLGGHDAVARPVLSGDGSNFAAILVDQGRSRVFWNGRIVGPYRTVASLSLDKKGKHLAFACDQGIWHDGVVKKLALAVTEVRLSADGTGYFARGWKENETGVKYYLSKSRLTLAGGHGFEPGIRLSNDGTTFALCNDETQECLFGLPKQKPFAFKNAWFSSVDERIAYSREVPSKEEESKDEELVINGQILPMTGRVERVDFSKNGKDFLVVQTHGYRPRVSSFCHNRVCSEKITGVFKAEFSPNGNRFAVLVNRLTKQEPTNYEAEGGDFFTHLDGKPGSAFKELILWRWSADSKRLFQIQKTEGGLKFVIDNVHTSATYAALAADEATLAAGERPALVGYRNGDLYLMEGKVAP